LMRAKLGVERDVRNFRRIFDFDRAYSPPSLPTEPGVPSRSNEPSIQATTSIDEDSGSLQDQHSVERRVNRMIRRNSLDPNFVNQYDVVRRARESCARDNSAQCDILLS
jgi:hypothetical protein